MNDTNCLDKNYNAIDLSLDMHFKEHSTFKYSTQTEFYRANLPKINQIDF